MAKNIYEELLRKHTLEELKDRIPAEKSLEGLVSPSSISTAPKSSLQSVPQRNSYPEVYGGLIFVAAVVGIFGVVGHIEKRDSQYDFNGYIGKEKVSFYETALLNTDSIEVENENGTRIIYQSNWRDDDTVTEVLSVKSENETIICERSTNVDNCLEKATKIALEYKQKILETKGFNEAFKK